MKRTLDEGQPIDPKSKVYDGTEIDGPSSLRRWLVANYSDQFVEVAAEKLLTYALGRGLDPAGDMPLVRSIAHDAAKHEQPLLDARARRGQEQGVPDEYESAGQAATDDGGD